MTEIECLQAECKALKCDIERANVEKDKFASMYEEALEKMTCMEKRIEFLLGQIEAYKYCFGNIRR